MLFKFKSVENNNYLDVLKENGFKVLKDISNFEVHKNYRVYNYCVYIELNDMKDMVKLYNVVGNQIIVDDEEIIVYDGYME